jgi:phospholipid/cholesterol/gamma-HCH transport system permease protein
VAGPPPPGSGGERLLRPLGSIGRTTEHVAQHAGQMGMLLWGILTALVRGRVSWREIMNQMYWMGVGSLPIVIITAMLAGIVTSQQGGYQFTGSVPLYIIGSVVTSSIVLELGPVMTAVVLIGRVGARITAEFGTMQVSEQIDAMHALGRDPVRVLAAPRVIAGVIVVPILVGIANTVGIFSGMVAAGWTLGLGRESFFYGASLYWHNWDMFYSLSKGVTFGFVIPFVAVHMGFRTRGGAEGVGRATTASVMFMTLAVLILDAVFPPLLLN